MFLLSLFIVLGVVVVKATASCPSNCSCTTNVPNEYYGTAYDGKDTLMVICPSEPALPDLRPLKNDSSDKLLIIEGKTVNGRVTLTKDSFPRGLKIRELLFRKINYINITDDAFENLQYSLLRLDVSYTELKVGGPLNFLSGLIHLDILELYNTYQFWAKRRDDDLGSVFSNMGLDRLRILKMSSCYVYNATNDAFVGVENLKELYLDENKFTTIPRAIGILANLEVLDLSKNNIKTLKGSLFRNNRKLKRLLLADNPGLEIKFDAFIGLENSLVTLDLKGTGQEAVPTVPLSRMKVLKYLNISENAITEMETGSLQGEYCLKELSLEKVDVQLHPKAFEGQTKCIQVLSISGRDGPSVPTKAMASLDKLQYMKYAYNNHITTLTKGSFSGVRAKTILLEELTISFIDKGAFDGVHIPLNLYLQDVAIHNLSFVLDYPKGTFQVLSIKDVPVTCDCHLVQPLERLQCALTGICEGEYPYYYVDEQALREKLSKCPNSPDFSTMYLKCDKEINRSSVQSLKLILLISVVFISIFNYF